MLLKGKGHGEAFLITMGLLLLLSLPKSLMAQSGTGMDINSPIFVGSYSSCGGADYSSAGNYRSYNGITFYNNYGSGGPDVWYSFTLVDQTDMSVWLDAGYEGPTLHLLNGNGNKIMFSSDSYENGGLFQHSYYQLPAGTYYVVVDGSISGGTTGDYSLYVGSMGGWWNLPDGANMLKAIKVPGVVSCGTNYTDTRSSTGICMGKDYQGPNAQQSNDIYYQIHLNTASQVNINTCGSSVATWLHVLDINGAHIASNGVGSQGSCMGQQSSLQLNLSAGFYYVVVQGSGVQTGNLTTNINVAGTGNPPALGSGVGNAVSLGSFSSSGMVSDQRNPVTECLGDSYGSPASDVYHKFVLHSPGSVKLWHTGASYQSVMWLLDANGALLKAQPFFSWTTQIEESLPTGTYYVVSEREWGHVSPIQLNLQVTVSETCTPLAAAISQDRSYTAVWTPSVPMGDLAQMLGAGVCKVGLDIQYYDELGRPTQTVQVKGNADATKDIVTQKMYDAQGRLSKSFLPYTSTTGNGSYRATVLSDVTSYYGGTVPAHGQFSSFASPFSMTVYEPSPLNRVLEQGAPGDVWQPASSRTSTAGRTIATTYGSNAANEVRLWELTTSGAAYTSYYGANQLFKTIFKDENWTQGKSGTREEFKDKEGHVVLKRTWESETSSLSTYYIYDDWGNLRYILPPAIENSFTENTELFDNFIYAYHHDKRNRLVEKKIPGKAWEYMVYNRLDQLVATQDGNQRMQYPDSKEWTAYKYDVLGREIQRGKFVTDGGVSNPHLSRLQLQNLINTSTAPLWESRTAYGYTNDVFISNSWFQMLSMNCYDDYNYSELNYYPFSGSSTGYSAKTKGLLTGTWISPTISGDPMGTAMYYDDKGRMIQSRGMNAVWGEDIIDNVYSFTGELEQSTRRHTAFGNPELILTNRYIYDHVGRKVASYHKIGTEEVQVSSSTYGELGQLVKKKLHNGLKETNYTYNSRGWIREITSLQFSERLKYEDGTSPQYNGNISNQLWGTGTSLTNTFTYGYDHLNRLVSGVAPGLSEYISYNKMGNITSLTRDGYGANNYVNYTGNQLRRITGFVNGYIDYDANGNMMSDNTRNGGNSLASTYISYNLMNLPENISGPIGNIGYNYDQNGRKLEKWSAVNGNNTTTSYSDGIEYVNGVLLLIHTEEGIVRKNGNDYNYEYAVKDHLGNSRYNFDVVGAVIRRVQQQDYYPFGLVKSSTQYLFGDKNKYLYNGKELQEELSMYDYGARFYDPVIARWNVIDPSADEEGQELDPPYGYVANNPVSRVDPDGKIWGNVIGAVVGAAVEYGSQVVANVAKDGFKASSFTKNIDVADIALAGAEGFLTSGGSVIRRAVVKGTVKVASEVLKNTVDYKDGTWSVNSGKSIVANSIIGVTGGVIAGAAPTLKVLKPITPKAAVKAARNAGVVVNRAKRLEIAAKAATKQKVAEKINEKLTETVAGVPIGGASEVLKRKNDEALKKSL